MKKRLLCLALSCAMVMGTASAAFGAFSDISDPKVQQDAAALNGLGIMQGVGNNLFAPNEGLTRAQFSKLAATALGCTDITGYASYTIFPDVPNKHWAAGYINAVVKHPDIEKKQVIRGFADGTFGPEKPITYGEACTMLLRMLDYTVTDIGPNWPADYIARAQALGIANGVDVSNANAVVKRSDAAVMLCNTLASATKDGSSLLTKLSGSAPVTDSVLLATADTDPSLGFGQLRFYENQDVVLRSSNGSVDPVLVGAMGTVVFEKNAGARVKSFLPDNDNMESHVVKSATQDKLETDGGSFTIPRKTPLVINGDVASFSEAWFNVLQGDKVNFYYDDSRQLQMIAVDASYMAYDAFVYGVGDASVPEGYRLQLNGVDIERSQLRKYQVITLDSQNRTAVVSDKKITGLYESASPSFAQPEKVTIMGKEFFISEQVAKKFAGRRQGEKITLLLDAYNTVQDVCSASEVNEDMVGIYKSSADGNVTVELLNGVTVSGQPYNSISATLLGKLVSVSNPSTGKLRVVAANINSSRPGDWLPLKNTLGSAKVSPNLRLYEQMSDSAPLHRIDISDVSDASVSSKDIRYAIKDGAGTVTCLVIGDVTGDGWDFGIADYEQTEIKDTGLNDSEIITYEHKVSLTTIEDGKVVTKNYLATSEQRQLRDKPVGIPKGLDEYEGMVVYVPTKELTKVGTVSLDAFDRGDGVRVSGLYYQLAAEPVAYAPRLDQFITFQAARANYSSFTLYADGKPSEGGKIRMIYAE